MSLRAYVDVVTARAPEHTKFGAPPPFPPPVRIAVAIEDEHQTIIRTFVRRVLPPVDARVDLDWCATYGVRLAGADQSESRRIVGPELIECLAGVTEMVAHVEHFHRRALAEFLAAVCSELPAVVLPAPASWSCTMRESVGHCRIPLASRKGFKSPKLAEAYRHFAGVNLPPYGPDWRENALSQLAAIRLVFWGIKGWGAPKPLEVAA